MRIPGTVERLRTVHSLTGLVPLGAYLGFHAWEHWPIRAGREAVYARLARTSAPVLEIVVILVPLLVHAALGLWLRRQPDDSQAYASPAFRALQAVTGAITGLFLLFHVGYVWGARVLTGSVWSAHAALLDQAGGAGGAALHVVALTAVCTHFGQGLSAAFLRAAPGVGTRPIRALSVLAGALLFLVFVNELAAYAAGAALM